MKFSTRGRYALRMMAELAASPADSRVPLKTLSERQNISLKYLEQIVACLTRAGLVKAERGSQGGYVLTRPADQITAGDILRAIEGSMAPIPCLEDDCPPCPRAEVCCSLPFWEGLGKVIDQYVDSVTLDDLRRQSEGRRTDL